MILEVICFGDERDFFDMVVTGACYHVCHHVFCSVTNRGHRTLNIIVQCSNVRSCSANIRTGEHWSEKKIKEHSNIEHLDFRKLANIRTSNI